MRMSEKTRPLAKETSTQIRNIGTINH